MKAQGRRTTMSDKTETMADVAAQVGAIDGLTAREEDGLLRVEKPGERKQAVADAILEVLPIDLAYKLKLARSDDAANAAWFEVDGFDPLKTFPLGKEG